MKASLGFDSIIFTMYSKKSGKGFISESKTVKYFDGSIGCFSEKGKNSKSSGFFPLIKFKKSLIIPALAPCHLDLKRLMPIFRQRSSTSLRYFNLFSSVSHDNS